MTIVHFTVVFVVLCVVLIVVAIINTSKLNKMYGVVVKNDTEMQNVKKKVEVLETKHEKLNEEFLWWRSHAK